MTIKPATEHDPQTVSSAFHRNLFPQSRYSYRFNVYFHLRPDLPGLLRFKRFHQKKLSNAFHLHSEVPVSNTVHDTDCSDMVLIIFFSPSRQIPGCYFELWHDLLHPFQFIIIQRNLLAASIGDSGGPTVPPTAKPPMSMYLPIYLSIYLFICLIVCLSA
jgi:hypothetical protein